MRMAMSKTDTKPYNTTPLLHNTPPTTTRTRYLDHNKIIAITKTLKRTLITNYSIMVVFVVTFVSVFVVVIGAMSASVLKK